MQEEMTVAKRGVPRVYARDSLVGYVEPSGKGTVWVVILMGAIFIIVLGATIGTWYLGDRISAPWPPPVQEHPSHEEPHLHEVLADALKVTLGALLGVMTQWASFAFAQRPHGVLVAQEARPRPGDDARDPQV
jgi:hypothetical protein